MEGRSLRVPRPGKRTVLLVCMLAGHAAVAAADVLPAYLRGTWGTAESLYAGEAGQSELHLASDGYGLMAGSTAPARRIDGQDDGAPGPRALIGFPLHVTLDGATLTARVVALDQKHEEQARRIEITCSYEAAGPTLTCKGPGREPVVMKRRSETVPEETSRMLEQVRSLGPAR